MSNINFGMNILPKTNNTYTLGSSDYKWNIFANELNGVSVSSIISGGSALPSVTASDNGKVLGVVNGAWTTMNNPLPAVTSSNNNMVLGVINGSWNKMSLTTNYISRPSYLVEVKDPTIMPQINDLRANRLAFLPSD